MPGLDPPLISTLGKIYQIALMKENVHCRAHVLTSLMFAPSVIMFSYLNDRIDSDFLQFFLHLHFLTSLNNCRQIMTKTYDPIIFVKLIQKF